MQLKEFIEKLSKDKELVVNGFPFHVYSEDDDTLTIMGTRSWARFDNILIFASKKTFNAYAVDKDLLWDLTGIDFIPSMDEIREEMWNRIKENIPDVTELQLRFSSLELKKQKYLTYPDKVIADLTDEIRVSIEKAA